MSTKVSLVTGANRGIGFEVARGLGLAGFRTLILCRDEARGRAARDRLPGEVVFVPCDLANRTSVTRAAGEVLAREHRLDVLVHNAGVYPQSLTLDDEGVELSFAVDVISAWRLTALLLPLLEAADGARIVQLAGIYHLKGELDLDDLAFRRRAWDAPTANAQAQLARVVATFAWSRRLAPLGITANAVHPGPVLTDAIKDAPWAARVLAHTLARPAFHDPSGGAAPVLHLATKPDLHVTGAFYRRFDLHASCETAHDLRVAARLEELCR